MCSWAQHPVLHNIGLSTSGQAGPQSSSGSRSTLRAGLSSDRVHTAVRESWGVRLWLFLSVDRLSTA